VRSHAAPESCRDDLPPLVAAYVARFGLDHPERTVWTRIEQQGEMRLSEQGKWLPLTAVQHSATITTSFLWQARVLLAPGLSAAVVDGLAEGQGFLEARLFGALPLAKSDGDDTIKGEALRYLAELPWNPAALACNRMIDWRDLKSRQVSAEIEYFGIPARVVFSFDGNGDIVDAGAADRPRGTGRGSVPTPWGGAFRDYREVHGFRIPAQAVAWWDLPGGRFLSSGAGAQWAPNCCWNFVMASSTACTPTVSA